MLAAVKVSCTGSAIHKRMGSHECGHINNDDRQALSISGQQAG